VRGDYGVVGHWGILAFRGFRRRRRIGGLQMGLAVVGEGLLEGKFRRELERGLLLGVGLGPLLVAVADSGLKPCLC
jgi:hypothetical protein